MNDSILYERRLPHGPVVRIRRTSAAGVRPVTAVVEVERRSDSRAGTGTPPPLVLVEGDSDQDVLARLEPFASDDTSITRLMRDRGLR